MKRWVGVLVLALAMVPCARADEASKRVKVQELFTVMKMDAMMEQLMKAVMAQTENMFGGMMKDEITPAQNKVIHDYQDRAYKLVMGTMGWKQIEPEYVEMYANTYTEEEIDGILAFYKSPAGAAMLAKTPELMTKSTTLSQQKMVELQPKMKEPMEEMVKEMTKDTAPAASTKPGAKTSHPKN